MGNHYQLRADGVSGPAEAKLWERGEGDERKVPGALLRTKR